MSQVRDLEIIAKELRLKSYPQMFLRLARHLLTSERWDSKSGRPIRAGKPKAFVAKVLEDTKFYEEAAGAADALGLQVASVRIDGFLIDRVKRIPLYKKNLIKEGFNGRRRVVTGGAVGEQRQAFLDQIADRVIDKPIPSGQLISRVNEALIRLPPAPQPVSPPGRRPGSTP